jgi:hypothetical protein
MLTTTRLITGRKKQQRIKITEITTRITRKLRKKKLIYLRKWERKNGYIV